MSNGRHIASEEEVDGKGWVEGISTGLVVKADAADGGGSGIDLLVNCFLYREPGRRRVHKEQGILQRAPATERRWRSPAAICYRLTAH